MDFDEGIEPSGACVLAADGDAGSGGFADVEGELAQDGEVFGGVILAVAGVILAVAGAILVEGGIEHPVEAILDAPVGAKAAVKASTDSFAEGR